MSISLDYDPIQKLEEIQPRLEASPPGALPMSIFKLEDGRDCPVYSLLDIENEVSVAHFFMPEGGVFETHKHDEFEVLIPYSGEIRDLVSGRSVGPRSILYAFPGQAHRVMAVEDTWGVAVTVPSSEGLPHAKR